MSEVLIRDQVKKLVELQALDAEIYALNREKVEKPKFIQGLQKDFGDKKTKLNALEDKLKQLQVQRKLKELELQAKEDQIKHAQTQLFLIKTNKEYQAKLREIEGFKADKSVSEEDILKIFDEVDVLKAEVDKENAFLKNEEEKLNAQSKTVEERLKEIAELLTKLDLKRKQIIPDIDKKIILKYERILKNRDGLALVPIKNEACQGCFMNVPPQVINEIKSHEKVVICEVCARILYLEEDI
ncbi:MAG: C4-type zinc ribbon domain-containing protein [Candidatus Omnitrophota bacterium]|nr:C4-type zinc ribbon domain-containing protein [Candidatus Omnitrophota bacterium]